MRRVVRFKQPHGELALEPRQRRADGGGRDAQGPGGGAEGAEFDDAQENQDSV